MEVQVFPHTCSGYSCVGKRLAADLLPRRYLVFRTDVSPNRNSMAVKTSLEFRNKTDWLKLSKAGKSSLPTALPGQLLNVLGEAPYSITAEDQNVEHLSPSVSSKGQNFLPLRYPRLYNLLFLFLNKLFLLFSKLITIFSLCHFICLKQFTVLFPLPNS